MVIGSYPSGCTHVWDWITPQFCQRLPRAHSAAAQRLLRTPDAANAAAAVHLWHCAAREGCWGRYQPCTSCTPAHRVPHFITSWRLPPNDKACLTWDSCTALQTSLALLQGECVPSLANSIRVLSLEQD